MSAREFNPTAQQVQIIEHEGSAFIAACPGAGKTRVLVERARRIQMGPSSGKGIAFLSFTIAAVSELEHRLRREGLIRTTAFPNFIGTFDAFLWQFLVAPFGVHGCLERARLIPDKDEWLIKPFDKAQELPLECFDRSTGKALPELLARYGFKGRSINPHETSARNIRARSLERGELDFADARDIALARLRDPTYSTVLSPVLSARFQELIVDEAQDCNPIDLEIITWFREAGIPVKVISDPNQAIYGFRGGITDELVAFAEGFASNDQLLMTGNFRSSNHIAKAIVALRAPTMRSVVDEALGEYRNEPTPVHVLSYSGNSVPASVGSKFRELTQVLQLDPRECPILSATRQTGATALGYPPDGNVQDMTYRLAVAVSNFHCSFDLGGRKDALQKLHKVLLEFEGRLDGKTYHQYVVDAQLTPELWRPDTLVLAETLRFNPTKFASEDAWLMHARAVLVPRLPTENGKSINQRLKSNKDLSKALSEAPRTGHSARTIHSVKGMEFPAVCVVVSTKVATGLLDFLTDSSTTSNNEDARKIYVGASRAQRLLVIAVPKSQAARLVGLLDSTGATVKLTTLGS
jgi:DNA helicase II / ATP-dependent DNA helicase PcrA